MIQINIIKAFIQKILPCYRRIHTLILVLTSLWLKSSVWRPRVTDVLGLAVTNPAVSRAPQSSFAFPLHPHPHSIFLEGS